MKTTKKTKLAYPPEPTTVKMPNVLEEANNIIYGQNVLEEANNIIYGQRQQDYGSATENFTNTSDVFSVILRKKLKEGVTIDAHDVGLLMIGLKLCREVNVPKRDNLVDLAGYAGCLDKLTRAE